MDQALLILEVLGITFIAPILLFTGILTAFKKRTALPQTVSLIGAIMMLSMAILSLRPEPSDHVSLSEEEITKTLKRDETERALQSWGLVIFCVGFASTSAQQRKLEK